MPCWEFLVELGLPAGSLKCTTRGEGQSVTPWEPDKPSGLLLKRKKILLSSLLRLEHTMNFWNTVVVTLFCFSSTNISHITIKSDDFLSTWFPFAIYADRTVFVFHSHWQTDNVSINTKFKPSWCDSSLLLYEKLKDQYILCFAFQALVFLNYLQDYQNSS